MNAINTEEVKAILEKEKETLLSQLSALMVDKTRGAGPISQDWEEQAQEVENDQIVDQLESLELSKLNSIETALKKIENGNYGTCIKCHGKIKESRIIAIPFTEKCIRCE